MKVLVFTTLYPNNVWPNQGVFIKERMTQFAKLDGCEVKVVAPVPYFPSVKLNWRWRFSQVARCEFRDGIEVYHPRYFMMPKFGMALYGWMMFLSVLSIVRKLHKEFDFDLIDAHYVYPDGFAAIQLGRMFKKPVVVSARGSDINLFKTFPLIRKLLQHVLRRADGVIAVSQALRDAMVLLGIPQEKISVISNGVDAGKFYPMPKEQARRELGLSNRRMILSVGNITPNKGFDLLVRALGILAEKFAEKDLQLVIAGDGPSRSELERTIASLRLDDRVRLVGAIPHDQLHVWYSAADLFCLASSREGWPNVILESLACGTPVVSTSAGGIPEIICSDKVGLLVERDETKIAAAIRSALNKHWPAEDLVGHARLYTWERSAGNVLRVFASVLETKNQRAVLGAAVQTKSYDGSAMMSRRNK